MHFKDLTQHNQGLLQTSHHAGGSSNLVMCALPDRCQFQIRFKLCHPAQVQTQTQAGATKAATLQQLCCALLHPQWKLHCEH
jgi:hypothetical protein